MSRLTRDQVLQVSGRLKEVDVPEWGGSVFIRPLTLAEQAKLMDLNKRFEAGSAMDRLKYGPLTIIQWAVSDESGAKLFLPEDIPALMNKPLSPFYRLQDEILALTGMTKEAREEIQKNLLTAANDGRDLP